MTLRNDEGVVIAEGSRAWCRFRRIIFRLIYPLSPNILFRINSPNLLWAKGLNALVWKMINVMAEAPLDDAVEHELRAGYH